MPSHVSLKHIVTALTLLTPALAQLKALTYVACYKNSNGLSQVESNFDYQTDGHCQERCVNDKNGAPVLGLSNGGQCYCGAQTPANGDKVDDSNCNVPCNGFPDHMCGGNGFFSVYLTGTQDSVSAVGGGSSSSGSGNTPKAPTTTSAAPSVITSIAPGRTVVVTQSATSEQNQNPNQQQQSGGKSNTTAIIAGVVVGIVVVLALAGGLFFLMRHRRRRQAEEEYKQHQVSDFMAGGKPTIPAQRKHSGHSGPDPRFDAEAMAHRRLSDGSIADNEDYSRRILKVTNPDDRR